MWLHFPINVYNLSHLWYFLLCMNMMLQLPQKQSSALSWLVEQFSLLFWSRFIFRTPLFRRLHFDFKSKFYLKLSIDAKVKNYFAKIFQKTLANVHSFQFLGKSEKSWYPFHSFKYLILWSVYNKHVLSRSLLSL